MKAFFIKQRLIIGIVIVLAAGGGAVTSASASLGSATINA